MNRITSLSFVVLVALTLVGCGSGGSSDASTTQVAAPSSGPPPAATPSGKSASDAADASPPAEAQGK